MQGFGRRGRALYGGELPSRDRTCVDTEPPGTSQAGFGRSGFPEVGPSLGSVGVAYLGAWLLKRTDPAHQDEHATSC